MYYKGALSNAQCTHQDCDHQTCGPELWLQQRCHTHGGVSVKQVRKGAIELKCSICNAEVCAFAIVEELEQPYEKVSVCHRSDKLYIHPHGATEADDPGVLQVVNLLSDPERN